MRIEIIDNKPALSAYIGEILTTWGLPLHELVTASLAEDLDPTDTPVLIVPALKDSEASALSLESYAQRGGTVIVIQPQGQLATLAGLIVKSPRTGPLRLRQVAAPMVGPAGQPLVVVGPAYTYEPRDEDTQLLAYLSDADQYYGESVGVTRRRVGAGHVIASAFDLPRCVMLLRQGSPERSEVVPESTVAKDLCTRASYLALDIGGPEAAWSPFADLLGRYLVTLVCRHVCAPLPLISHLPGDAQGLFLLSGDEDDARPAETDAQMEVFAKAGARMNLYVVPDTTRSSPEDLDRYRRRHDVGPHPNLRPLDGRPSAERIADFERQLKAFTSTFNAPPKSVRNHGFAWAGYLDLIEVEQRCGVRMDANFASGAYRRYRQPEPFFPFGSAMPMRFCQPDGRLIDVFQQHTHVCDDISFSPAAEYSYKYTVEVWEMILARLLDDMLGGGHFPFVFDFHPGNWQPFAEPYGRAILQQAADREVPVWSLDQWCDFWHIRDTWRIKALTYKDDTLRFSAGGSDKVEHLRWLLPATFKGARLKTIAVNDQNIPVQSIHRYGEPLALFSPTAGECSIEARYVQEA